MQMHQEFFFSKATEEAFFIHLTKARVNFTRVYARLSTSPPSKSTPSCSWLRSIVWRLYSKNVNIWLLRAWREINLHGWMYSLTASCLWHYGRIKSSILLLFKSIGEPLPKDLVDMTVLPLSWSHIRKQFTCHLLSGQLPTFVWHTRNNIDFYTSQQAFLILGTRQNYYLQHTKRG